MTMNEKYLTVTKLEGYTLSSFYLNYRIAIPASKILYMEEAFYLEDISDEEKNSLDPCISFWINGDYLGTKIVFDPKYHLDSINVVECLDKCVSQLEK